LHLAAASKACQQLVKHVSKYLILKDEDAAGRTPLHLAAAQGFEEVQWLRKN
jgi:ankyrin repeat protein